MTAKRKPRLTQSTVRHNYAKQEWWTPAEAAHFSERSMTTVRQWMYVAYAIHGRMRFKLRRFQVSDRIDRDSFLKYLDTGKPQGMTVSVFKRVFGEFMRSADLLNEIDAASEKRMREES